jgi:hypothetical protein
MSLTIAPPFSQGFFSFGRVTIDGHFQTGFFGNVEVEAIDKGAIAARCRRSAELARQKLKQASRGGLIGPTATK